nr:hypothetical protein [Roseibium aggregatum]
MVIVIPGAKFSSLSSVSPDALELAVAKVRLETCAVFPNFLKDVVPRIRPMVVGAAPYDDLDQDWREVASLFRQIVDETAAVLRVASLFKYAFAFKMLQAVDQYVRCDAFVGLKDLAVGPLAPQHDLPNDQQRPAISKYVETKCDRTTGCPFPVFLLHFRILGK